MDRKLTHFETYIMEKNTLNCRDVATVLYGYVECELSKELHHKIDHHLTKCEACKDSVGSYKMVVRLAQELGREHSGIPDSAKLRLREGLSRRLGVAL